MKSTATTEKKVPLQRQNDKLLEVFTVLYYNNIYASVKNQMIPMPAAS